MTATSWGWYARRLRRMSPREVGWRTSDAVRRRRWARRQVTAWDDLGDRLDEVAGLRPGRTFTSPAAPVPFWFPDDLRKAVTDAAERVLAGEWEALGVSRPDIADPDWFHDVVTGVQAPAQQLAFAVPHRDEAVVGNIKAVWEISRHHHLTLLAAAWWCSGDERFARAVDLQLRSWWHQNPFLSGVHWTSGIELAVRLISWSWIRRLLGGWDGVHDLFDDNPEALWQLRWHQEYLAAFFSRGSSANNHVVAEVAGLLTASCAFPWFDESPTWRETSMRLLSAELDRNTFPSGVNRELATDYHRFVTELGLVAAVESAAAGHPLPDATWQLLGRSLDVAAALLDCTGEPPRQGDGDEGRALVVDPTEANPWLLLLSTGRRLVGAAPWWPDAPESVQGSVLSIALGDARSVSHLPTRPDVFPDAGMTILRSARGSRPELWCRCDGGPYGFLSIAAHAHADALSLELRHDGVPLLVDPGTYCYHGEPEWRTYFRSTVAHNTIEVDGNDQAVSGGPFLWTSHADAVTTSVSTGSGEGPLAWSGSHDAYRRLSCGAFHRRSVELDADLGRLVVDDAVTLDAPAQVVLSWHLGPDVQVELDGATAALRWDTRAGTCSARFELPSALRWARYRGEFDPVAGWYSPKFGRKVPAATLRGTVRATQSLELRSVLILDG